MKKITLKVMLLFLGIILLMYVAVYWNAKLNEKQELKEKQVFYDSQCKLLGNAVMNYTDEKCFFSLAYIDEEAGYYACDILCEKNTLTYNLTNSLENPIIKLEGNTPKTPDECLSFALTNPNKTIFTIRYFGEEHTCFLDINLSTESVCTSINVPKPYMYVFKNNTCFLKQTIALPINNK